MSDFTLTYKLRGRGWAEAVVSAGGQEIGLSVSYLSDALGDLTRATLALLREPPPITVCFAWQDEPGEYRWIIRSFEDRVHIRLLWFNDSFSRRGDEEGELLCEADCALLRLVRQVKGQLDLLLTEWGEDGYRKEWGNHDFPRLPFLQLEALFEARKTAK